ncbi:hypothetical protein C8J57DRAFT_1291041 [Mycena rebaudengoi]|nr:hypothetical protein C8J57DRAFT_1291041 [Mycena rebaudengoi]
MYIKSPFPPLPPLPEVNIYDLMLGRPDQAQWPEYTLYIDEATGLKRTFRDFQNRIALGATALGSSAGLGLNGGEVVGLLGYNSMDYIEVVWSLLMITTPFALISAYSTRFELVHALKLIKPTRLFVDAHLLNNILSAIQDPDVTISADNVYILSGHVHGRKSLSQMIDIAQRTNIPLESIRSATSNTLAYLVMSSGTSGLPKAVQITHGNLVCATIQGITVGQEVAPFLPKMDGIPIILAVLPMFHASGLHSYILRTALSPTTYVILDRWNTKKCLNSIAKYRVTHMTLVPSMVHQLVNHPDIKAADLTSLVRVLCGAAYLPPELAGKMSKLLPEDSRLTEGYGMSECTIGALMRPVKGMLNLVPPPDTTGVLLPGMDGRLLREDGSEADYDEVGELYLRGANISPGYWNNEAATKATFVDGWLRTGDFFRIDENGYAFFADRGKDTLKVSGVQVSPVEIENVLLAHPSGLITDVAVAGVSGGRTEDEKVPRAWVVLSSAGEKKGAPVVVQELEDWHKQSLSKYKWLQGGIEVIKEIPKTPTGKTLRRALQERYAQRVKKAMSKL